MAKPSDFKMFFSSFVRFVSFVVGYYAGRISTDVATSTVRLDTSTAVFRIIEFVLTTCYPSNVSGKIRELSELKTIVTKAKAKGQKVVFTNGCFDLLHLGHVHLLREAKKMGDLLVVALNSDRSVKKIKGSNRPILPEAERAELLAALETVDYVTLFNEPDPSKVIEELKPDVLVKGGDWTKGQVIGGELVEQNGGKVVVVPYLQGHSTTKIIEAIRGK